MFRLEIHDTNKHVVLDVYKAASEVGVLKISSQDDFDLSGSSKFRTKLQQVSWSVYKAFREQIRVHIRAILHNTTQTGNDIRQIIERYTRKIPFGLPHEDRIQKFAEIASLEPLEMAKDLLRLEQRAVDLDAQLLGMSLIVGDSYSPVVAKHPLNSLIHRCAAPFWDNLVEQNVKLNLRSVEHISIVADFRLFNCAMYHFFDNIKKYIKPDSEITVSVTNDDCYLKFEMISRAMVEGEQKQIFHESYSGRHAGAQKGEGFGMYIFSEVLGKMGATPYVEWPQQAGTIVGEYTYQKNIFGIRFPNEVLIHS